jgi:hypothetical protein
MIFENTVYWRKVGDTANAKASNSVKCLISLALPRGLEPPVFAVRGLSRKTAANDGAC